MNHKTQEEEKKRQSEVKWTNVNRDRRGLFTHEGWDESWAGRITRHRWFTGGGKRGGWRERPDFKWQNMTELHKCNNFFQDVVIFWALNCKGRLSGAKKKSLTKCKKKKVWHSLKPHHIFHHINKHGYIKLKISSSSLSWCRCTNSQMHKAITWLLLEKPKQIRKKNATTSCRYIVIDHSEHRFDYSTS